MIQNNYFMFVMRKLASTVTITILVFGFGLITLLSHSNVAFAHAGLVKAEPARRATLAVAPKQIRLWFNEEIEADYASLSVLNANNETLTNKKPVIHPDDPKSIYLELPELPEGRYTVKYRILSIDGHVLDSEYKFTVKENKTK